MKYVRVDLYGSKSFLLLLLIKRSTMACVRQGLEFIKYIPGQWFLEAIGHFVQHACMHQETVSHSSLSCTAFFGHAQIVND